MHDCKIIGVPVRDAGDLDGDGLAVVSVGWWRRRSEAANMRIEDLRKRWDEHATKHPIVPEMTFADGFLVLGAGTRLAKVGAPLNDLRLAARLAATHRRPIEASPLRYIQRALAAEHNGDGPLAFMHIALSRLGKLADPREDARWLFMIDALLEAGGDPLTIVRELGTDPAACGLSLEKYSPDQPRVPAGNGRPSGQWVGANSSGSATSSASEKQASKSPAHCRNCLPRQVS